MQSDQQIYQQKVVSPHAYQVGGSFMHNGSMLPTAALGITLPPPTKHSTPLHGVELQPLDVCPKNFIIFDQTDKRSRIMFHPALAQKFSCPGFDIQETDIGTDGGKNDEDKDRNSSPTFKENTEDIDALLSLEDEEQEDGDEVSTARTLGSCGSSSMDSYSNYGSKPSKRKISSSIQKLCSGNKSNSSSSSSSSGGGGGCSERKRLRMKKMVNALRGIVPGGDQMNTVAVLDEAVNYLKSLKVEVEKLGLGDLKM